MPKLGLNKNGLSLPEKSGMCCFVLPIKIGVMIICILTLLIGIQAGLTLVNIIQSTNRFGINEIIWIIIYVPLVYAAYLVIMFFVSGFKINAFKACQCVIFVMLVTLVWWLIASFTNLVDTSGPTSKSHGQQIWIPALCEFLVYFYFMNVCRRYA